MYKYIWIFSEISHPVKCRLHYIYSSFKALSLPPEGRFIKYSRIAVSIASGMLHHHNDGGLTITVPS